MLSGFSILSSSFISAQHIGSIEIVPSDAGLKICDGALAGLSAESLSICMTNAYLDKDALSGISAGHVILADFKRAHVKPYVNRKGLGLSSFAGCNMKSIDVLDVDSNSKLYELLSSNVQCIPDGCSINNNMLRASSGKVIAKPFSRHLCIEHVDDAYDYSVVSCNWAEIVEDYKLTQKDLTSKNALNDVVIEVPEGVDSICSNAFSAGVGSLVKNAKSKAVSPVTCIKVAKSVKSISKDAFDGMSKLKSIDFN